MIGLMMTLIVLGYFINRCIAGRTSESPVKSEGMIDGRASKYNRYDGLNPLNGGIKRQGL